MTNFPEKIASALMDSIMAAFRTEAADLRRLAEEVDAAGQDVEKIRATIERYANTRTQAMETIHTTLTAEVEEFKRELGIGNGRCPASRSDGDNLFDQRRMRNTIEILNSRRDLLNCFAHEMFSLIGFFGRRMHDLVQICSTHCALSASSLNVRSRLLNSRISF